MTSAEMEALIDLASRAGAAIMSHVADPAVELKRDGSPVTAADREGEAIILEGLERILPGIPVVSEEAVSDGRTPECNDRFILVDALDGTKEMINHSGEFTVNIGLIENYVPVAGVVYAPALETLWAGTRNGAEMMTLTPGARTTRAHNRRPIMSRRAAAGEMVVLASLRHRSPDTDAFVARITEGRAQVVGSSIKFCRIAEGLADIYPRLSPTMQWDTAAGDAVLRAAGGTVLTAKGEPFTYGPRDGVFRNGYFVAGGDPGYLKELLVHGP